MFTVFPCGTFLFIFPRGAAESPLQAGYWELPIKKNRVNESREPTKPERLKKKIQSIRNVFVRLPSYKTTPVTECCKCSKSSSVRIQEQFVFGHTIPVKQPGFSQTGGCEK